MLFCINSVLLSIVVFAGDFYFGAVADKRGFHFNLRFLALSTPVLGRANLQLNCKLAHKPPKENRYEFPGQFQQRYKHF